MKEKTLNSLGELVRSLNRIFNCYPTTLLKCDIQRLERAKAIIKENAIETEKVEPSNKQL